jgi:hypothetical protein
MQRVLLGKFPDGHYGLRVSEPGYDVASNPVDNERMVFNSDWPSMLPLYLTGVVNLSGSSVTIPFAALGSGYIPFVEIFILRNGESRWELYQTSSAIAAMGFGTTSISTYGGSPGTFYRIAGVLDDLLYEGGMTPLGYFYRYRAKTPPNGASYTDYTNFAYVQTEATMPLFQVNIATTSLYLYTQLTATVRYIVYGVRAF